MAIVEVVVVVEDSLLYGLWPSGESAEVVVSVAFDVGDAEEGYDGEILEQGNGADVCEILAG